MADIQNTANTTSTKSTAIDYIDIFLDKRIYEGNEQYPLTDIGTSNLFYDLHGHAIRFVDEANKWYLDNSPNPFVA